MNATAARNLAEKIVRKFAIDSPPVDVELIAEKLGLRVIKENLGDAASGLLITTADESIVVIHSGDAPHRQRFTLAHEIGHYALKHHFGNNRVHIDNGNFISRRSSISSTGVDPMEIEANQFAASLLMPAFFLNHRIKQLSLIPLWDHHVSNLAEEFDVSEQAMTIRLTSLGHL